MASSRLYLVLSLVLCLSIYAHAWYDGDACCALAKLDDKFLDISPKDAVCGQSYHLLSNGTPVAPAPDAYVSYSFCRTQCPGWGRSKANVTTQWAAPIVQFLLPSVIFALTTPRTREMETRHSWFYEKVIVQIHAFLLAWTNELFASLVNWLLKVILADLLVVIIDTVVWIFVIIMLAGPMLIEGLFEALLDFRIIRFVRRQRCQADGPADCPRAQLLLTVVSGNLDLGIAEPQKKILAALDRTDVPQHERNATAREAAVRTRLLSMMGSQSIFGAAVGAPVLFYLGAFLYTILDLENSPSSQDAAISLAFGIEWMIVVHVAIVAGCLLASNNPSTSSAIVGLLSEEVDQTDRTNSGDAHLRPGDPGAACNDPEPQMHQEPQTIENPTLTTFAKVGWHGCVECLRKMTGWSKAYETVFQPVPMWRRGSNKMKWLRETQVWEGCPDGQGIKRSVGVLVGYWLFLPTFVFVMLPSIAGAVVAYATPPVGFGCRSLSFICYAGCQFVSTVLATMELDAQPGSLWPCLRWLSKPWEWMVMFARGILKIITWPLGLFPETIRSCFWVFFFWFPFRAVPIVGSLFTAVGGTLMQIIGVYRTCLCYVNAPWWFHLDTSPGVNLASDTEGARLSSHHWFQAGVVATGFMAVVCYLGWSYQENLRHLFREEVRELYSDVSGNRNRPDGPHGRDLREGVGQGVDGGRSPSPVFLPLLRENTELSASKMWPVEKIVERRR